MMNSRNKRMLEIAIALLVIFGLVIGLYLILKKNGGGNIANPDRTILEAEVPDGFSPDIVNGTPAPSPETNARAFVERFGSFSNQSGYSNIDDVLALATPALQPRLSAIADEARASEEEAFYGISTQVIAIGVESETEASAELLVGTQRTESIDSPANSSTRVQNMRISIELIDGRWLVSDFEWE